MIYFPFSLAGTSTTYRNKTSAPSDINDRKLKSLMNILVYRSVRFHSISSSTSLTECSHHVRVLDLLVPQVHGDGAPQYVSPEAEFITATFAKREPWNRARRHGRGLS